METEKFVSGYCRQLDGSRMVEVVLEDGAVTETDCCYGSCVYQSNCTIAKESTSFKSSENIKWQVSRRRPAIIF